jgi:hypothetical protein
LAIRSNVRAGEVRGRVVERAIGTARVKEVGDEEEATNLCLGREVTASVQNAAIKNLTRLENGASTRPAQSVEPR